MKKITHLHSSSRYDRSAESLRLAATSYNRVADLVTYTEVEAEFRESAIRKANGDEFGFVSGDKSYSNDCALSFRKERFQLVFKETYKSTTVNFYTPSGQKRDPQYATNVVLKDKETGRKLVISIIHLASSVEGDLARKIKTKRTINWYASFAGSKRRANQLRREHKADAVLYVADFNIDFKKDWARRLVKALAPSYLLTWRIVNIKGGTHGNRIIDGSLIKGKMGVKGSARLWTDDASSDHRPYVETLQWL